jgi:K+-sensing histidine kinase KdpD
MTTHKHHVLCAVDYSASSRTALRYASVAAQQIGATLTVLNVANPSRGGDAHLRRHRLAAA